MKRYIPIPCAQDTQHLPTVQRQKTEIARATCGQERRILMRERSGIGGNYAPSRDTQRLGLSLGHRLGQLDSTSAYVTDDRFDHGAHDALHRRLT